jgi:CopG family transcriptional regulator/antitoxin EndoAI
MNTSTVNISFKNDLLEQIDQVALEESRTRSELIREAARLYIERKKRWESIFDFGNAQIKFSPVPVLFVLLAFCLSPLFLFFLFHQSICERSELCSKSLQKRFSIHDLCICA